MVRMEIDCNLKKLANFFKFLQNILEKLLKLIIGYVYSSSKNSFDIVLNIQAVLADIQQSLFDSVRPFKKSKVNGYVITVDW